MIMSILSVTDENFKSEVLDSEQPVLVDFWMNECGPCRAIAPHLESLSDELGEKIKIVKLNVEDNQQSAIDFKIRSAPTLIIFKNGVAINQLVGNPGSKIKLTEFINKYI